MERMLKYVPFAPYADREIGHVAMAADAALRHLSQKEDGAVANPTALAEGMEIIWWRYNPSPRKRLVPRTVRNIELRFTLSSDNNSACGCQDAASDALQASAP